MSATTHRGRTDTSGALLQRASVYATAAALALILLALAAPAYAEDAFATQAGAANENVVEIALPKSQVADLLAKAAELDATRAQLAALQAVIAAQQRQIDAQAALVATQDELLARQAKLTTLADEESAVHQKRAERLQDGARWANAKAQAGVFGLACAPAVAAAPFGPAIPFVCALAGGVYGYFSAP